MSHDWKDDGYVPAAPRGTAPPSPVAALEPWRDEHIEAFCKRGLRDGFAEVPPEDYDTRAASLGVAVAAVSDSYAALADIEAEWRSETRRGWFRWGLAEIDAERQALKAYRSLLEQGRARLNRLVRERNKRRQDELRAEAERKKDAHRARMGTGTRSVVEADVVVRRLRNEVLAAAHELAAAPAEAWGPDEPMGLRLRSAVTQYEKQVRGVRDEHHRQKVEGG